MQDGQKLTKETYEDSEIVEGYIQRNALNPKNRNTAEKFADSISGKNVLDLGCGPGHDSYYFAEKGFDVVGMDYSSEMIRRAKDFKKIKNMPKFKVGDMRYLSQYFEPNTFNAIWACASLLHIRHEDIDSVLKGISYVAKNNAGLYIGLKGGNGKQLVKEEKLGKPMQREFTLWTKEEFLQKVAPYNWILEGFHTEEGSQFLGKPTEWLNFFFTVKK